MSRLQELRDVYDKVAAEITMLERVEQAAGKGPGGVLAADAREFANQAMQAKAPEQIIDELFTYHPPDAVQATQYETIRDAAKHLAMVIWKNCPYGADRTAAIRKLRQTVMTANAAIALRGLSV